jgi:hypothetical protein
MPRLFVAPMELVIWEALGNSVVPMVVYAMRTVPSKLSQRR